MTLSSALGDTKPTAPAGSASSASASGNNNVGFNAVPNVNVGPTATTNNGLPVAIFPTQAQHARRAEGAERGGEVVEAQRGLDQAVAKRGMPTADDEDVSDGRYLPRSTVPNEAWGGV